MDTAEFERKALSERILMLECKLHYFEIKIKILEEKVAEFENQEEKATAEYFENLRNKK